MHQFFALLVSPTAELARKANHQSVSVVELDFTSTEEPVPNAHQNAQNVTPKDASPASQDFTWLRPKHALQDADSHAPIVPLQTLNLVILAWLVTHSMVHRAWPWPTAQETATFALMDLSSKTENALPVRQPTVNRAALSTWPNVTAAKEDFTWTPMELAKPVLLNAKDVLQQLVAWPAPAGTQSKKMQFRRHEVSSV